MLTQNNILKFLTENKEYLKKKYFLDKIGLVGSFSRGDFNENSDIDLIVYFNEDAKNNRIYRLYINLQQEIKNHFHKEVDIIANGKVLPAFKKKIQKEALYV